jgi:hypothetical protein
VMDGDGQPRVVRVHRLVQELIRRDAGEGQVWVCAIESPKSR